MKTEYFRNSWAPRRSYSHKEAEKKVAKVNDGYAAPSEFRNGAPIVRDPDTNIFDDTIGGIMVIITRK